MYTYGTIQEGFTRKEIHAAAEIAEQCFHTRKHPEMMPIDERSISWILDNTPNSFVAVRYNDAIVGCSFGFPVSHALKDLFITGAINEHALYKGARDEDLILCESFYIAGISRSPEHAGKNVGFECAKRLVDHFASRNDAIHATVFWWPISAAGKHLVPHLQAYCEQRGLQAEVRWGS
jgi:hypothetical protein